MLIRDNVIDFYNQLALAGMKAPDFTEEAIQDFQCHFQYMTAQELFRVGEVLRSRNRYWPTYSEILEAYEESYAIHSRQEESGLNDCLEQMEQDAYPDGEDWQEAARIYAQKNIANLDEQDIERNLFTIYWYMRNSRFCNTCDGYSCPYLGHKPSLIISDNKKELHPMVRREKCSCFAGYTVSYEEA